jgi:hypothetical protein
MATAATIKKNIAKLEAALKSKATPKSLKSKLETQLVKSKAELSGMNKGTKPKTSTSKSAQTALQKLKEMVNKNKKLKTYKKSGVDLEKDADRPALPIGRRTAKQSGKTYYEYRANRIDVKQPPKRYPKLEKGGYMAKGGEVAAKKRLEELREELRAERISYGELAELESLKEYIDKGDVELLEAAGVSEYDEDEYAKGGMSQDEESILVYYVNHYPEDELALEIKAKATFNGLYEVLSNKGDAYEYIGVADSIVRERVFEKLAKIKGVKYDVIYDMWMDSDYAKGGYVAVSEKNDYWTIITKPTTKEKAQEMLDLGGLPRGEVGKVVTLEEAKAHKNTIGKEYLEKGGYFAKGGAIEHGLMVGDTVRDVAENSVAIYNVNNRKSFVVDLDKGTRTEWIGSFKDRKKYAEKGAYMAMGGEMHRTQE